jgi:hypothetical protein
MINITMFICAAEYMQYSMQYTANSIHCVLVFMIYV